MSDMTPWIVTVHLPNGERVDFRTPPAEKVELASETAAYRTPELVIRAGGHMIGRFCAWSGVHAVHEEPVAGADEFDSVFDDE